MDGQRIVPSSTNDYHSKLKYEPSKRVSDGQLINQPERAVDKPLKLIIVPENQRRNQVII